MKPIPQTVISALDIILVHRKHLILVLIAKLLICCMTLKLAEIQYYRRRSHFTDPNVLRENISLYITCLCDNKEDFKENKLTNKSKNCGSRWRPILFALLKIAPKSYLKRFFPNLINSFFFCQPNLLNQNNSNFRGLFKTDLCSYWLISHLLMNAVVIREKVHALII